MSTVKTAKAAQDTATIVSTGNSIAIPGVACLGNGKYVVGVDVPTMKKQAVKVSLNIKFDKENTGRFERFDAAKVNDKVIAHMTANPGQWRIGYNVKFTKDNMVTYCRSDDAMNSGFLTEAGEDTGLFVWNKSELAFEAASGDQTNGKFIA